MYRITGDKKLQDDAWRMFQSIDKMTRTKYAHAAIDDVRGLKATQLDYMESFWLAETLKYFYLIFSEPDLVNLDDYVLYVLVTCEEFPPKLTIKQEYGSASIQTSLCSYIGFSIKAFICISIYRDGLGALAWLGRVLFKGNGLIILFADYKRANLEHSLWYPIGLLDYVEFTGELTL
jgi:hypothetical protein